MNVILEGIIQIFAYFTLMAPLVFILIVCFLFILFLMGYYTAIAIKRIGNKMGIPF